MDGFSTWRKLYGDDGSSATVAVTEADLSVILHTHTRTRALAHTYTHVYKIQSKRCVLYTVSRTTVTIKMILCQSLYYPGEALAVKSSPRFI